MRVQSSLRRTHLEVVVATAHHNGYLAARVDLLDELPNPPTTPTSKVGFGGHGCVVDARAAWSAPAQRRRGTAGR